MSALVKAKFIEKHHTEKFTYQITGNGREYLEKHQGPITDQDLKNLDGYEEAQLKVCIRQMNPDRLLITTQ